MILFNFFTEFLKKLVKNNFFPTFAPSFRELSSVGSEHLPYKQRVTGSNPVAPTSKISHLQNQLQVAFFMDILFQLIAKNFLPSRLDFPEHIGRTIK